MFLEREKVDLLLDSAYSRRVSERVVAGALHAFPLLLLRLLSLTALSELWSSSQPSSSTRGVNQHQWWLCGWISIPGDGGLYSSVAAGPCLREVGVSSAPPSPDFDSGGEGFHSLASPALGVSIFSWVRVCSRIWIGCGFWFMVPVVRGSDLLEEISN
ncbi:hypothetical protein HID58_071810 [Brassica napus]|uniref:Uncharacterized protein n=1 Tax=Brassica napus TaxID=3708 RepID=A0ABQ7Z2S5_BRANA|nr:hypothetical protein HID58_071810 [Brassica napus]